MYGGFLCANLYRVKFLDVNGLRIVARTGRTPLKISLNLCFDHLLYENFSAYIVDQSDELTSYEIPIANTVSDRIREAYK